MFRGGALWIRYAGGTLLDLAQEAGCGEMSAQDGANAIAVRQPVVHWHGTRALFSMLVVAPAARYQVPAFRWPLYWMTR